ncbi:hypothetical protein ACPUEX_22440 [Enterobacter vonholyi]
MYSSLNEFIEEQERENRFYKRKLNLLLISIQRKHSDDEIIELLEEIVHLKKDLESNERDYLYHYIATTEKINTVILMMLINMKCKISKPSEFSFYEKVVINKNKTYTDDEVNFLSDVFYKSIKKYAAKK